MIKNIPNKYTQKMLLALIEERFRGMFGEPGAPGHLGAPQRGLIGCSKRWQIDQGSC